MLLLSRFMLLIVLCCSFIGYFASLAHARSGTVNKIAAVVNGEMITLHELRRLTVAELQRQNITPTDAKADSIMQQVLETRINDILLRQEALRYKLTISDIDLENELQKVIQSSKRTRVLFEAEVTKQGMTMDMMKERLRDNMLRQRLITVMISRKVVVTKEEVAEYYEANKKEFVGGKKVDFSVIIFPQNTKAEAIYSRIKSGDLDFEAAARQYSRDSTANNGGRVGSIAWGSLPGPFQRLLSSLQPGKVSPIVTIESAPAIIRLNEITEGGPQSFEQASAQIERVLREPRLQARFNEYTQQLRSKAVVDIRL